MKKENIIGFSVIVITILVLFFLRNYSISSTYTIAEKKLTLSQVQKEVPLLEISEEDYLLRDILLEWDMVQEAVPTEEDFVLLDAEKISSLLEGHFPEDFVLKEAFVMGETVGLDLWSEEMRVIYEIFGKDDFYKTVSILDEQGMGEPIYTNRNNEEFIKMKKHLDKIEIELR